MAGQRQGDSSRRFFALGRTSVVGAKALDESKVLCISLLRREVELLAEVGKKGSELPEIPLTSPQLKLLGFPTRVKQREVESKSRAACRCNV